MNEWYFYQDQGKTVGPYSVEDIRERIREGQIRVFDMIYKDGEIEWRMALEYSFLRSEFKASTLASLRDKPWVILQKRTGESLEFATSGPFSQDEVRYEIQTGVISYSDYAWKDGLQEWKRIGSLEEFNPRARPDAVPPVPPVPQDSSVDLLKNVVELRRHRPQPPIPDEIPPEAEIDFLGNTQPHFVLPPQPNENRPKSLPPIPVVTPQPPPLPAKESAEKRAKKEKTRHLMDWSVVAVLVLVLSGVVLIYSRLRVVKPIPKPQVEMAPVAAAPPPKVEEEDEEDQPKGKEPTDLTLLAQAVGNHARIEIRSNGSAAYPVFVQVIGLAGQVTEGGSYYRFVRYVPTGNALQPLDLSDLKLPEGKFVIRAETGDLKKEAKFTLGQTDPLYKSAIVRQRKLWAPVLWKERITLYHLAQTIEKQLGDASGGKKFSGKGLDTVKAVTRANPNAFLLFDDWWELHQIVSEAKNGFTPSLLARVQKEREKLSTLSVWK